MAFRSELNDERLAESIRRLLEDHYDLGKLTHVREISGGYCNTNYGVWMSAGGRSHPYFLRWYHPNAAESEILFEHALLNHLKSAGFTLAANIVPCRSGATVIHTPPPEHHGGKTALWALYEFLQGEDKYSWTFTDLTDREFISAAEVLARLHHCGHGFKKPPGTDRVQPRITEFVPTFRKPFSAFLEQDRGRRCDRLFRVNLASICRAIDDAAFFDIGFRGMKELPIHCDYHPGNLKYRNERCVGIFDFDWAKIDYRLFDVALGLVYFTSIWDKRVAGLRRDKFALFLNAYNEACRRLTRIDPLTVQELENLVPMLSLANLFVLNWDLVDFYGTPDPDDEEYYRYIDHNIGLMHWIEAHGPEIGAAADQERNR